MGTGGQYLRGSVALVGFVMLLLLLPSCSDETTSSPNNEPSEIGKLADDARKELGDAASALEKLASAGKAEVEQWMRGKLDELEREVAERKKEASKLTKDAREKWDDEIVELEKRLKEMRGRMDKIAESGLIPIASEHVAAPAFKEASQIFECVKIYSQDFDPANFLDPVIEKSYPKKDYHRIYFGEIVNIKGDPEKYHAR